MSLYNKNFQDAIASTDASFIRGKMGIDKGNKFIQDSYNKINKTNYSGFNR